MDKPIEVIINSGDINRVAPFGHVLGIALKAQEQKSLITINRLESLVYSVPPRNAKELRRLSYASQTLLTDILPRH